MIKIDLIELNIYNIFNTEQREPFDYKGRNTNKKNRPPFIHERVFHNVDVIIYMKEAGGKILSSEDNRQFAPKEAVFLKCDTYFLNIIKDTNNKPVEVIAIHLRSFLCLYFCLNKQAVKYLAFNLYY